MKTIKYLSIAAASLILASCAKEEFIPDIEPIPAGPTTVTFVSSCETKTSLDSDLMTTKWDENENVLLWEGKNALTIGEDNKSYEDGILTITTTVGSTESTFYSVIGPTGEGNVTRTSAAVLATQNPKPASFDPNAEILVAQPAKCSDGNTVALRYNRPVAITVATLKNLEVDEKVQSVKITADMNLTGNVNFTYEGTNVKAAMDGGGNTITCEYNTNNTVGESGEFPVYFISLNAEVRVFEFEVCTDKHKYYRKITRPEDSPIVLNDNRVATFGFKLENADKADAEGDKFVKVTEAPDDWSGEYLLVYEDNTTAYCWTGVDAADCNTTETIADGAIASQPEDAVTITIASMEGGYSVLVNGGDNNGKYIYGASGKNEIKFGTTASANTLSYDSESSSVLMTSNASVMRYNSDSGNNRFRYFKSSSYTSQKAIQLYKKTLGGYGLFTLHTPTNIQYDSENNKITWDAVENAGRYTISLNGGEPIDCEINEYSTSKLTAEYYYASVIALPSAKTEDTYKQSEAGSHEGWFKIGEPKMPALVANDITLNITSTTITASWENDATAKNGYIAEIWSRKTVETGETDDQGNPKTRLEDDILISKNENVTEGTITFTGLTPGLEYHIKITTKAVDITDERGTRAYANSTAANKLPKTSSVYTIAEIFALESGTVACQIENAVIYAKGESCYLVNDGTGYIMVNASAGENNVGDKLTISGKTEKQYDQKRFDNTTTIVEKTGDATVEHPVVASYDNTFTYAKYVKIVGKMTSNNGWLVTDASGNKLKVLDNDKTGDGKYVSVTGYLTHATASYNYLIATEIVEHTLTASPAELTWEANKRDAKDVTIGIDEGADWTFSPTDNTEWNISKSGNKLSVCPASLNTSINKKELTVTLTHATNTQLTKEIKLSQNGKEVLYELVTSVDNLADGDKILLVYDGDSDYAAGALNGQKYMSAVGVTIINNTVKSTDAAVITLGKSGNNWTLTTTEGKIGATEAKALSVSETATNYCGTWTIAIDTDNNATITSTGEGYGRILYNYNNGSPRFMNYKSNLSATMCLPRIYKLEDQRPKPTITSTDKSITTLGSQDVSEMFQSNSTGEVSYTISGGTLNGTIFSSTEPGDYTVTFKQAATTTFQAGQKEETIHVSLAPTLKATIIEAIGNDVEKKITVEWVDVDDATAYTVHCNSSSFNVNPEVESYTITELEYGVEYDVYVTASASGYYSSNSGHAKITLTDPAKQDLNAPVISTNVSGTTVTVNWTDVANATSYFVECGTQSKTVNAGVQTAQFTCTAGSYEVYVTAKADGYNDSKSDVAVAEVYEQLAAPANFTKGIVTSTTIPVSWSAVANATAGYQVSKNGSAWTDVSTTSYTFDGLTASTQYTLYVRAKAVGYYTVSSNSTITVTTAGAAKTYTYTFTSKSWADATSSWTSGKDGNGYTANQGVQVTSGTTGANATSKSSFTNVSKIVVNYCTNKSAGVGTIKVQVGSGTEKSFSVTKPSSGGTTLKNAEFTFSPSETGNVKITVACDTNSVYINSITITAE